MVDKFGDTHGLMRLIEGKKLADLRRKFPELGKMQFRPHGELVKERRPAKAAYIKELRKFINPHRVRRDVHAAYRGSKTGADFSAALGEQGYFLGRGLKTYALIDRNGDRHNFNHLLGRSVTKGLNRSFPDLPSACLCPASNLSRYLKTRWVLPGTAALFRRAALFAQEQRQPEQQPAPFRPMKITGGWPEAAIRDWIMWGYKYPAEFFRKWPELAKGNPSPGGPR
jgi:hypothetical protein